MDHKENNAVHGEKTALDPKQLEGLSEEQLNKILADLLQIKAEKGLAEHPTIEAVIAPEEKKEAEEPSVLFPDPTCFDRAMEDAERDPKAQTANVVTQAPMTLTRTRPMSDTEDMDDATVSIYRDLVERRKKRHRLLYILISVSAVLLIAIVLFAVSFANHKPNVDDTPAFETGEGTGTGDIVTGDSGNGETPPSVTDSYQRRDEVYNFLVLGIDRAANLSDVIMVVSYDVKNKDINVLALPRDTYINVGANYNKLNSYFAAQYNNSRKTGEERYIDAIKGMMTFIENGLCIKLDRYICMDLAGFREIVDAVGGVTVDVPMDMKYADPEQDLYIDLKAGEQHLNGAKAEQFVRFRKGYVNGDIGRISAQRLFLTAFAKQVKENLTVQGAINIAGAMLEYVMTDVSLADIGYFAKHAISVDLADISFVTLPGDGVNNPESGASYYVLYADATRKTVNGSFNVYTREITAEVFLQNNRRFTSEDAYIKEIYYSTLSGDGVVSAGALDSAAPKDQDA